MHGTPPRTYSEAWIVTSKTVEAVWRDRHGLQVLQQQRTSSLKTLVPLTTSARAMTVKYYRHFARVQSEAEKELQKDETELAKHNDLMQHLKKWDLELPEPHQMRFHGDDVDELICTVLRNWKLTQPDEEQCRQIAIRLFPEGVSMFRFRDRSSLNTWAELVYKRCDYDVQQDSQAFFLEKKSAQYVKEHPLFSFGFSDWSEIPFGP